VAKLPARLENHPSVRAVRGKPASGPARVIDADRLRQLCLDAGADDAGFVPAGHPDLAGEAGHAESALPGARSYVSLAVRMNRGNVRSPARSVANQEFHRTGDLLNQAAHDIVRALEDAGYRAINPPATFPMETGRYPGRIRVIARKPAAGMGAMGIHRNVIHPKYGNFILLGTILADAEISEQSQALDCNPCLECKLRAAACPAGAISKDGVPDFQACTTRNYREFTGGFTEWAETIADSKDGDEFRDRVTDPENSSPTSTRSRSPAAAAIPGKADRR
jgi:hypothetical protein